MFSAGCLGAEMHAKLRRVIGQDHEPRRHGTAERRHVRRELARELVVEPVLRAPDGLPVGNVKRLVAFPLLLPQVSQRIPVLVGRRYRRGRCQLMLA